MTAPADRRHLRLVGLEEPEPDPTDPAVWRPGLAAARAALAAGRSETPPEPDVGLAGRPAGSPPATCRPRLPDVAHAWTVLRGGRDDGGQR